jgi:hypothetical protein
MHAGAVEAECARTHADAVVQLVDARRAETGVAAAAQAQRLAVLERDPELDNTAAARAGGRPSLESTTMAVRDGEQQGAVRTRGTCQQRQQR